MRNFRPWRLCWVQSQLQSDSDQDSKGFVWLQVSALTQSGSSVVSAYSSPGMEMSKVSCVPETTRHTQMIRYNSWLSHAHVDTWHWDSTRLGMIRSSGVGMEQVSQDFMERDKKPVEWSLPCGQGTRVMRDRGNICTKKA